MLKAFPAVPMTAARPAEDTILDSFPAYFPLAGRKVVIAGSGDGADNKARLFEGSPATIVRLDGHAAFLPGSYAGAVLAFVASDDEVFVQAAAAAARAARVLVNVVDKPALCDFNTPAVIDRGEVVAAVGTGGSAPVLATMLRNDIEAQVPEGAGRVAALLRRFQEEVRKTLPAMHERRSFLRDAATGRSRPGGWPATWRRPGAVPRGPGQGLGAQGPCASSPARVHPTC
jgi:siroheme synthase (precorrin-2 oxidase/ferrochelatase)